MITKIQVTACDTKAAADEAASLMQSQGLTVTINDQTTAFAYNGGSGGVADLLNGKWIVIGKQ